MFCTSLSKLVKHLQPLLFMTNLPHPNGFGPPAVLVVDPLGVSSSSPPFRPGLSVLKQLSSEVAGAGDGPRVVEVNTWGSSRSTLDGVVCAHHLVLSPVRAQNGWGTGLSPGCCAGSHRTQQHRSQQGLLKVSSPGAQQVSLQHEVRTAVALCSCV